MGNLIEDILLIRYLTGEVHSDEIAQVEEWCTVSDENQRILEQLYFTLQVSDRLRIMKSINHNTALLQLKDRIRRKEIVTRRRHLIQRLQRVAAVLFLPLVMFSTWLLLQKDETSTPIQYVELYSNPGMVAAFELPDGSNVWLNGGSRLRYPAVFNGKSREVEMNGQGYFEITHNDKQPFTVRTSESFSLEVLGTSFNLSAYDDEDFIETILVEGSVRLKLQQNGKMVQREMKPNEKVIYTKKSETVSANIPSSGTQNTLAGSTKEVKPESVKVATIDPQYDIAWKDRQILFKYHPMEQVIRTLGRYYNVQFVVKDEKVMESVITGKFSNEQLPQVMEYLKIASGIKYNIIPASVENGQMKPEVVEIWR